MSGTVWKVLLLAVVVFLATPAMGKELLELLTKVVEDLPALKRAFHTNARLGQAGFQARSGLGSSSVDRYCFQELGCLETGEDFYHSNYRPINLEPEPRQIINTMFTVLSKEDLTGVVVRGADVQQVLRSSFKPKRETKVLIHGYLNGRDMPWMTDIARVYLQSGDYNLVTVDWTDGSLSLYSQAVANARVVGLEIAHFVNYLRERTGLRPGDVHLIGHSLGAHVCGYAGERIAGLGRITGLDPAEPYFQFMPSRVRLDPTDALLVDVIHTDAGPFSLGGGYGLAQPVGHLDFYPNEGLHQPGCNSASEAPLELFRHNQKLTNVWRSVENVLGCNHIRSVKLFADSIASRCPYMAFSCDSYERFRAGKCFSCGKDGSKCATMGNLANTWPVRRGQTGQKLYLTTGGEGSLCMYHYRLRVKLGQLGSGGGAGKGFLNITVFTPTGKSAHFDLTAGGPKNFNPGRLYTFILEHGEDLSSCNAARVTWSCSQTCNGPGLPLSTFSLLNVENFYQRRMSRSNFGPEEVVLCPEGGAEGVLMLRDQQTARLAALNSCPTIN